MEVRHIQAWDGLLWRKPDSVLPWSRDVEKPLKHHFRHFYQLCARPACRQPGITTFATLFTRFTVVILVVLADSDAPDAALSPGSGRTVWR